MTIIPQLFRVPGPGPPLSRRRGGGGNDEPAAPEPDGPQARCHLSAALRPGTCYLVPACPPLDTDARLKTWHHRHPVPDNCSPGLPFNEEVRRQAPVLLAHLPRPPVPHDLPDRAADGRPHYPPGRARGEPRGY